MCSDCCTRPYAPFVHATHCLPLAPWITRRLSAAGVADAVAAVQQLTNTLEQSVSVDLEPARDHMASQELDANSHAQLMVCLRLMQSQTALQGFQTERPYSKLATSYRAHY